MPPHAFAVERERLLGAAFRRAGETFRLEESHAVELPAGLLGSGPLGAPVGEAAALERAVHDLVRRFARRPRQASLVLPDLWARGMVVELGALPVAAELRAEVLRFRLRKLVPYRVEELRIAAQPIAAVTGQEDSVRALALYASEAVTAALERAFARAEVRLGQIVNASLARLGALAHRGRLPGLVAVAAVEPGGITLVFARDGEPVLWRQKSFADGAEAAARGPWLASELRLTRTFLAERLGDARIDGVLLTCAREAAPAWNEVLGEGLGRPVAALEPGFLPLAETLPRAQAVELAPLVGAACREVA